MYDFDTAKINVLCLGGSMTGLVQNLITEDIQCNQYLHAIPTRAGKIEALMALKQLAILARPIIAIGFAGGITPEIDIGNIVIPLSACTTNIDSETFPDKKLLNKLECFSWPSSFNIHTGKVWTSPHPIHVNSEEKYFLAKTNNLCVDMETYWLFLEAFRNSIPVAAILIVSDHIFNKALEPHSGDSNMLPQSREMVASVKEALKAIITILSSE